MTLRKFITSLLVLAATPFSAFKGCKWPLTRIKNTCPSHGLCLSFRYSDGTFHTVYNADWPKSMRLRAGKKTVWWYHGDLAPPMTTTDVDFVWNIWCHKYRTKTPEQRRSESWSIKFGDKGEWRKLSYDEVPALIGANYEPVGTAGMRWWNMPNNYLRLYDVFRFTTPV
jgi:hypothetical protein